MVLTLSRQFVTLTGTGKAVRVFLVIGLQCAGRTGTEFAEPLVRNTGNELCFRNLSPVFTQDFQQRRPGFCLPAIVFLCHEENSFTVIFCEYVDRNYVYLGSVTKYCNTG